MQRRIPELDGLRAIAVTLVVLWHYVGIPAGGALYTFFRPGRSGVDLFFVLSGFLITSILIENRGSANYYSTFYLRRALRILPIYTVMLALFFAGRQAGWDVKLFGGDFTAWTYVVFLQNFEMVRFADYGPSFLGVTWSLAVEEQFYLLFPFLVAFVRPSLLPRLLVALIIVAPILRIASYWYAGNDWAAYVLMPCRADSLAVGGLIAWAMVDDRATMWLCENKTLIRRACFVLLALAPLLWAVPNKTFALHMAAWGYAYLTWLYGAILLAVLLHAGAPALRPLRSRLALGVAAVSYALYLIHPPVLVAVFTWAGRPRSTLDDAEAAGLVAVALLASVVLSAASYFVMERPFLRLGRSVRFASPRHASPYTA